MKKTLLTLGLGAGIMYLLDPEHGSRRRTQIIDKIQGVLPKTAEAVNTKVNALGSKATDITARADDMAAEAVTTLPPQLEADTSEAGTSVTDAIDAELTAAAEVEPAS